MNTKIYDFTTAFSINNKIIRPYRVLDLENTTFTTPCGTIKTYMAIYAAQSTKTCNYITNEYSCLCYNQFNHIRVNISELSTNLFVYIDKTKAWLLIKVTRETLQSTGIANNTTYDRNIIIEQLIMKHYEKEINIVLAQK